MFCYINQLTFFGGCLVLNARRVAGSRHCVTCLATKSQQEMKDEEKPRLQILLCSGSPPRRGGEDDNLCMKCPMTYLSSSLLHEVVKAFVLILYILYLVFTIMGATKMDVGFNLEDIVPTQSYLSRYVLMERRHFTASGSVIMFVLDKPVTYENTLVQERIQKIINKAKSNQYMDSTTSISWLDAYLHFLKSNKSYAETDKIDFEGILQREFLPFHPEYQNDIILNDSGRSIITSRFYIFSQHLYNSSVQKSLMLSMREITHNTSLPLIIYNPKFIFYEHHVSILKTTLLTVTVTIISMLLIALMFIPHPVAFTCVTISMVSVVVGMMGCFYFLGTPLSAIQTVQLLIGVGLCLNYTVRISHSYMTATGKSRNERVSVAMDKVGRILFHGATCLILGVFMLIFAGSYIFTSFFKSLTMVILLSMLHALVILPVLLSFIGPRRTSKPRVFIPISPSCRSISADFHPILFSHPSSRSGTPTSPDAPSLPDHEAANKDPQHTTGYFTSIAEEPEPVNATSPAALTSDNPLNTYGQSYNTTAWPSRENTKETASPSSVPSSYSLKSPQKVISRIKDQALPHSFTNHVSEKNHSPVKAPTETISSVSDANIKSIPSFPSRRVTLLNNNATPAPYKPFNSLTTPLRLFNFSLVSSTPINSILTSSSAIAPAASSSSSLGTSTQSSNVPSMMSSQTLPQTEDDVPKSPTSDNIITESVTLANSNDSNLSDDSVKSKTDMPETIMSSSTSGAPCMTPGDSEMTTNSGVQGLIHSSQTSPSTSPRLTHISNAIDEGYIPTKSDSLASIRVKPTDINNLQSTPSFNKLASIDNCPETKPISTSPNKTSETDTTPDTIIVNDETNMNASLDNNAQLEETY